MYNKQKVEIYNTLEIGKDVEYMSKIDELIAETKLNDFLRKKDDEKQKNVVLWILAIIGAVAAIAGIAYAVYRFFAPDYLEDFDDDFDEDFDDYFSDEDQV